MSRFSFVLGIVGVFAELNAFGAIGGAGRISIATSEDQAIAYLDWAAASDAYEFLFPNETGSVDVRVGVDLVCRRGIDQYKLKREICRFELDSKRLFVKNKPNDPPRFDPLSKLNPDEKTLDNKAHTSILSSGTGLKYLKLEMEGPQVERFREFLEKSDESLVTCETKTVYRRSRSGFPRRIIKKSCTTYFNEKGEAVSLVLNK